METDQDDEDDRKSLILIPGAGSTSSTDTQGRPLEIVSITANPLFEAISFIADDMSAPVSTSVEYSKAITHAMRAAMVEKKNENPTWGRKEMKKWLENEHRVSVSVVTVAKHLKIGLEGSKK